jgi:hypothetical protein
MILFLTHLPYFVDDDNRAYIFSALDVEATHTDFEEAQQEGTINDQYKQALEGNLYAGATLEKEAFWLQLT